MKRHEVAAASGRLDAAECSRMLRTAQIGRLAMGYGHRLEIMPVRYMLPADDRILFRTKRGGRLWASLGARAVVFEVDGIFDGTDWAWSVVCRGLVNLAPERAGPEASSLLPTPWHGTTDTSLLSIGISHITGRVVDLGTSSGTPSTGERHT